MLSFHPSGGLLGLAHALSRLTNSGISWGRARLTMDEKRALLGTEGAQSHDRRALGVAQETGRTSHSPCVNIKPWSQSGLAWSSYASPHPIAH